MNEEGHLFLLEAGDSSMVEEHVAGVFPGIGETSSPLLPLPAVGSAKGKDMDLSLPPCSSELSSAKALAFANSSSAANSASMSRTGVAVSDWPTSSPSPISGKPQPWSESTSENMAAARR